MATRMGLEEITWSEIQQARDRLYDAAYLWGRRTDGLREADTERRVPGLGRGPGRGRQDQGGRSALVAPPLKGLQGLWGQRPVTWQRAGALGRRPGHSPNALQPQCFLSVLGLFF